jgi:hypothetical protein
VAEVSGGDWAGYLSALDRVAPLAEEALAAVARAGPEQRQFAIDKANTLDRIREHLVKAARQAAPKDTP